MKQAWLQISYCDRGSIGPDYGSGKTRMLAGEVAKWLDDKTKDGYPVLVTGVKVLTGALDGEEQAGE